VAENVPSQPFTESDALISLVFLRGFWSALWSVVSRWDYGLLGNAVILQQTAQREKPAGF